jgi:hypothetical protein
MTAVELGRDLDVQAKSPPGFLDQAGFRRRTDEIAAQTDKTFSPSRQ